MRPLNQKTFSTNILKDNMPQILRVQHGETTSQNILKGKSSFITARFLGVDPLRGYPIQELNGQIVYLDCKWQIQTPNSVSARIYDQNVEMTPVCINPSESKYFQDRLAALEAGIEPSVMVYKRLAGSIAGAGTVVFYTNKKSAIDATVEPKPASNASFFNTIFEHLRKNRIQKAVNHALFELDELLESSNFEKCDEILSQIEVEKIPIALMISFLGITRPYRDYLLFRPELYSKIEAEILKVRPESEKANLIGRLK